MNNKELLEGIFNKRTYKFYLRSESIKKIFNLGDVNKDYISYLSSKWFLSNQYEHSHYGLVSDYTSGYDSDNTIYMDDLYSITSYDNL
jgi:hypothetical protein